MRTLRVQKKRTKSCVWLFATLWTVVRQAPLSMGSSRQEYWSGLPCPPPGNLPNPGIEPRSSTMQVDSLLSEPARETKNTGVGSPSLLQGNFPTQELKRGLLHCRWILYQLSYLGNSLKKGRKTSYVSVKVLSCGPWLSGHITGGDIFQQDTRTMDDNSWLHLHNRICSSASLRH